MQRIRQRVKELTPRSRCHADIRNVIADLNPLLRGWGNYFRIGNAACGNPHARLKGGATETVANKRAGR
jgi:hypothetical protein